MSGVIQLTEACFQLMDVLFGFMDGRFQYTDPTQSPARLEFRVYGHWVVTPCNCPFS